MSEARFEISYSSGLRSFFNACGLGPRFSAVEVNSQSVRVHMGWAFAANIPRSAVASIEPDDGRVGGWGVHGWGGRWLVNGSSSGLIRLQLDPPARALVVGVPVRLRTLRVSVEDPEGLLRVLSRG
jgi:hypothetical protein